MLIYYSGNSSRDVVPEALMAKHELAIMLTFIDFYQWKTRDSMRRFTIHQRALIKKGKRTGPILNFDKAKDKKAHANRK